MNEEFLTGTEYLRAQSVLLANLAQKYEDEAQKMWEDSEVLSQEAARLEEMEARVKDLEK